MNIYRARVSRHAAERLEQRLIREDRDLFTMAYLWIHGRPAVPDDFRNFGRQMQAVQQYRVCAYKGREYMVVYDPEREVFVTLWQK